MGGCLREGKGQRSSSPSPSTSTVGTTTAAVGARWQLRQALCNTYMHTTLNKCVCGSIRSRLAQPAQQGQMCPAHARTSVTRLANVPEPAGPGGPHQTRMQLTGVNDERHQRHENEGARHGGSAVVEAGLEGKCASELAAAVSLVAPRCGCRRRKSKNVATIMEIPAFIDCTGPGAELQRSWGSCCCDVRPALPPQAPPQSSAFLRLCPCFGAFLTWLEAHRRI